MKINVSIEDMVKHKLLPNQVVLLMLLYHQDFDSIKQLFGKQLAIEIRDSLIGTEFLLSDKDTKFVETIISKDKVGRLLGIKGDSGINFWEFYNCYPIKVGSRVLRASGNSQLAEKHEKKYLAKVKTLEKHQEAIRSITTFVAKQKASGKLEFLPAMDTVMNNASWEAWTALVEPIGEENGEWNTESI
jgi:hypothetical protein